MRSPIRATLTLVPLLEICITSNKRKNYFDKDINHMRILSPAFKKRKIPPYPSNNALTTACSQWETTTTSNFCSSMNFCSKQPSPGSSENLVNAVPSLLFFSMIYHSFPISWIKILCNSLPILNKNILLVK